MEKKKTYDRVFVQDPMIYNYLHNLRINHDCCCCCHHFCYSLFYGGWGWGTLNMDQERQVFLYHNNGKTPRSPIYARNYSLLQEKSSLLSQGEWTLP